MADDRTEQVPGPGRLPGRRALERRAGLWPIGRALTAATVAAALGLAVVMVGVLAALGFPRLEHAGILPATQLLDVLKFVLGTVAGVGALFALVIAYRRQCLAEDAHFHDQYDAAERRVTELYNAAATQLSSDKAPVRPTALYTLERLANDNPRHRQTIVNIVCAYLRMPYIPPRPTVPVPRKSTGIERAATPPATAPSATYARPRPKLNTGPRTRTRSTRSASPPNASSPPTYAPTPNSPGPTSPWT
ncbi:hypothetical protein amrb99_68310 [Actinomadura sp. RB99]|uniref:hypothetical protein n=1 Tax=Actinomadura sp. RB99 TaxID=2691577 RepID=UPI001689FEFF|nr:hypothetical protein [Actinomadura sp. RB99]MBD2897864.1 hypothetical protein [Actinomadura sp. RB99]